MQRNDDHKRRIVRPPSCSTDQEASTQPPEAIKSIIPVLGNCSAREQSIARRFASQPEKGRVLADQNLLMSQERRLSGCGVPGTAARMDESPFTPRFGDSRLCGLGSPASSLISKTPAKLLSPGRLALLFLERWPHQCHGQLVVRRWEIQQIARAGHRFCGSWISERTGVCAGELSDWIPPDKRM